MSPLSAGFVLANPTSESICCHPQSPQDLLGTIWSQLWAGGSGLTCHVLSHEQTC